MTRRVINTDIAYNNNKTFAIEIRTNEVIKHDKTYTYSEEIAVRAPGVRAIIYSDTGILLSRECRIEHQNWDYRLCGGRVFDSYNEYKEVQNDKTMLMKCIEKKLCEECVKEVGVRVYAPQLYHISRSGSSIEWDLYYFSINKYDVLEAQNEHMELIDKPVWVSFEEVKEMCLNGTIAEERSAMVLLRFINSLEK